MAEYTYPSTLRGVLQAAFTRFELPYTDQSDPASGTPFINVVSDDISMVFEVSFVFTAAEMAEFKDWLKQDNESILRGATFSIDLPTENGIAIQEAIFAPDGIPKIDGVTNNTYRLSAKIIARAYEESILPGAFNTPENAFNYYFYSQYQYPDSLRLPLMNSYSKQDASGFSINGLTSGSYAARIDTDDIYTVYDLSFVLTLEQAAIFRAWLAQDEFNMLKGAAFNIPLQTEYGVILQVVRFVDGNYPQLTGKVRNLLTYSAKVIARTQMDDINGLGDDVFGPQVFVTLLYPYLSGFEGLSLSSMILPGGGIGKPYRESLTLSSIILAGGEVAGLPIVEYTSDIEELTLSSTILAGGIIKEVNVFYTDTDENRLSLSSSILAGGEIKFVTVRYDSSEFDPSELVLSSAILTGGSVGA